MQSAAVWEFLIPVDGGTATHIQCEGVEEFCHAVEESVRIEIFVLAGGAGTPAMNE